MESKRQKKFSKMFQKELGEIFQRLGKEIFGGAFITVTQVKVSPDLGVAKVYLSFLLAKDNDELLKKVQDNMKVVRQHLGNRIKNQVRLVPELHFYYDDTQEVAAKVESLFKGIEIPPEDKDLGEGNVYKE